MIRKLGGSLLWERYGKALLQRNHVTDFQILRLFVLFTNLTLVKLQYLQGKYDRNGKTEKCATKTKLRCAQ